MSIYRHIGKAHQIFGTAAMANGRLDDREYGCDRYRHSAINIEIGFLNFLYEPGTTSNFWPIIKCDFDPKSCSKGSKK